MFGFGKQKTPHNRLVSVAATYTNGTKTFSFSYDTANRLTGISYPNGINSTIGLDAEGRVTNIVHGTFVDRRIQRNALGYKTQEDIFAGLSSSPSAESAESQTADAADRVMERTLADTPASTNATEFTYLHNDNGCLTSSVSSVSSVVYEYDYENRLESVDDASSFVEYLHDASGARVGRICGTTTNYFVVDYTDGLKRPLAETDSSGTVTRFYVWSGVRLLCHIEADGSTFYYHSDELGSTLAITDSGGSVTDQFAYLPYGKVCNRTGTNATPFQWLGGYGVFYDSATDLHLTLHRAYSAEQKRFISVDPLGIDGGANLYAYGNLNPTYFVDPYGLSGLESSWSGGSGGQTYLSAANGSSIPWDVYEADHQSRSLRALADQPLLLGSGFTGYSDYGHNLAVNNAIDYVTAIPSAVVGEWAWGKTAGVFSKAPKTGATVFRQGTFADDAIGWEGNYLKGKQWAGENPLTTPNYAQRYGLPAENTTPHWVTGGKTTGPYTTRPAPPSHNSPINTGGGPEILPENPNSVRLDWFHMLDD